MKTVIWTLDLEPVTIIELPAFVLDHLRSGGAWSIPVPARYPREIHSTPLALDMEPIRKCELKGEPLRHGRSEIVMVFVDDWNEENALALQPEYLAGQLRDLRDRAERETPRW